MKTIPTDRNLVAVCGLYCGACKAYLREKCPGCRENRKAGWCKVRACGIEHGFATCADCKDFSDPTQCRKFNNFIAKVFALIFRSDRKACVMRIREIGCEAFAAEMASKGLQTIRRT
jgi:hypothetical protein